MKITIESFGEVHSTEIHQDATVKQMARAWFNLMLAASYSIENLIELFEGGNPNNWDDAWNTDD